MSADLNIQGKGFVRLENRQKLVKVIKIDLKSTARCDFVA